MYVVERQPVKDLAIQDHGEELLGIKTVENCD
jgi:hypothetical protein